MKARAILRSSSGQGTIPIIARWAVRGARADRRQCAADQSSIRRGRYHLRYRSISVLSHLTNCVPVSRTAVTITAFAMADRRDTDGLKSLSGIHRVWSGPVRLGTVRLGAVG